MDSITHILSAALWTEPVRLPVPEENYARWRERAVIVIAALLPDADGVLGWIDPALYATYHRKITHSLPGLVVLVLLSAFIAAKWPRRAVFSFFRSKTAGHEPVIDPLFSRLTLFASIAIAMHILGDWIGAWGLWPFRPFWEKDVSAGWVNSLDPILLMITGGAWAVQHFVLTKNRRKAARAIAILWVVLCAAYIAIRFHFGEKAFV